jgi:hypothetical protein
MCGTEECPAGEIVCTTMVPGVPEGGETSTCGPLPPSCDGVLHPDCSCVGTPECECNQTPEGYFDVTCKGV